MKKFITMAALMLLAGIAPGNLLHAQEKSKKEKKMEKAEERKRKQQLEEAEEQLAYQKALKALQDKQFVLEADQVGFRNGQMTYVSANTNFLLVNGDRGSIQVAFNTANAGPNGMGGVTVDGTISDLKTKTDKRGNTSYNFTIQGVGVSAQIFLTLSKGNNVASLTVNPNFNSRTLTLNGKVIPLQESKVFKGRSW